MKAFVNKFRRKTESSDPGEDMVTPPLLSDEMVRRDNFFHSCWMELKRCHPDMWELQSEIELSIAGFEREDTKDPDDDNESEDKGIIV